MRITLYVVFGAALIGSADHVLAQDAAVVTGPIGTFGTGARTTSVDGDAARFQRYRDLRDGPFLESFRYTRDTDRWMFQSRFDHVGYRDQRYRTSFNRFGLFNASFEWDQIPLFYSADTRTPYVEVEPGVLRIDDRVQSAGTTAAAASAATSFDLRQRRDVARFGLLATPTRHLDLSMNVSTTTRGGDMPWAGSFGFNNTVEVALPLDQRTTDVNAAAEWGGERGSLRVQYDGSWFDNDIERLVWDNPLRAVDSPTAGSSSGQMALWPDSTLNALSATGTLSLPGRSRATAYISAGVWNQNEALLPFTINSEIPEIPLARPTADAEANVTAVNLSYTSRPADRIWFTTRYRRYEFDNQTPPFTVVSSVQFDQTLQPAALGSTHAFGYVRNFFDADVAYDLTASLAVRAGYGLEDVERTFRLVESTSEHTVRVSLDSTRSQLLTVRGVYEHSKRTGSGLDEEVLDDVGEQVSLRQFDISDRIRDRVSAVFQLTPMSALGISATVGIGTDERPDALFGLQQARSRFFSLGFDVVPGDAMAAGLTWSFDRYSSLQRSRQANPGPQFLDPTRDWSTDAVERVHDVSAYVELTRAIPRTDIRLGYELNRSRSRYLYVLPADSTLTPPRQLPVILNELQRATVNLGYALTARVSAHAVYMVEKYLVDDFAFSPNTLTAIDMPGALILGSAWRPYRAHVMSAGLSYAW